MGTTLTAMQAGGGIELRFVAAIEGFSSLITTGTTSAVVTAWSGTDWTQAISGLAIRWGKGQEIRPWSGEISAPVVTLAVQGSAADTFGVAVFGTAAGVETRLTAEAAPDATTITVQSTASFPSSGEIHIGPECIAYTGTTATTFTGCTRGKYTDLQGDGGGGWGRYHAIGDFTDQVALKPIVSSKPRTWVGKWVSIYAHRVSAGVLDTKAQAQLVFAGRIVDIREDTAGTVLVEVEDCRAVIRDTMILRDQWTARVGEGIYVAAGWTFDAEDTLGTATRSADALSVVSSGAAGANQMNAGLYTYDELLEKINAWFISEYNASRLYHQAGFSLRPTANGTRTIFSATSSATNVHQFTLVMPSQIWAFLGWPATVTTSDWGWVNPAFERESPGTPYRRHITWDAVAADGVYIPIEGEVGAWFDNTDWLPPDLTPTAAGAWGVVQVDGGPMILCRVGTGADAGKLFPGGGTASHRFLAALAGKESQLAPLVSASMDDTGEIVLRQVAILTGALAEVFLTLAQSTGATSGYNGSYDTLPYSMGAAVPFSLVTTLESDLLALQATTFDQLFVIEKPTKMWEIFSVDFVMRASVLVWKSGLLRAAAWAAPNSTSVTHAFTEGNKAEAGDTENSHRTVPHISDDFVCNIAKIEYNRIVSGSSGRYESSITVADVANMEASGQRPRTLQARNSFAGITSSMAAVENLVTFIAGFMPLFSKPVQILKRSIDVTLYEGVAPGDHGTLTDSFVRDPATGARGITAKPCLVLRHFAAWPGFEISDSGEMQKTPAAGEVELLIYPRNQAAVYSPAAQVDHTAASAGYNSATKTFTFQAHAYSEASAAVDISHFSSGHVCTVIEMDPPTAASPLSWTITLDVVSAGANTASHTGAALVGWDTTKKYRMVSASYASATANQRTKCYQADDADGLIQDLAQAYEYSYQTGGGTFTKDAATNQATLYATANYGDGVPLDPGTERDVARTINNFSRYRAAPSLPILTRSGHSGASTWRIVHIIPVYRGPADLSTGEQLLWVRPVLKSRTGASVTARVALCFGPPIGTSLTLTAAGTEYALVGPYEQQTWTTTSTSYAVGSAYGFSTEVMTGQGEGYLVIEGNANCDIEGLAECRFGPYAEWSDL